MTPFKNGFRFLVGLLIASASMMPFAAHAQYSGLAAINKIILGTPGITATSIAGATNVVGAAAESALVNGMRIPIASTAATAIASGRMAGLAGSLMKGATGIGLATIIVPWIFDEAGLKICPPPDFICKKGDVLKPRLFWSGKEGTIYNSAAAGCASYDLSHPPQIGDYIAENDSYSCTRSADLSTFPRVASIKKCPPEASVVWNDGTCRANSAGLIADVPASSADISGKLTPILENDAGKTQAVYDGLRAAGEKNLVQRGDAVTVSAPSVGLTPQITTSTVTNPDGSTSTKVDTKQTVVNPTQTGTTVGDSGIRYPTVTTTTTNVTNNVTNITTTNVTTTTDEAIPDLPPLNPTGPLNVEFPQDYNKEATQQQIADELAAKGAPVLVDQNGRIITATDKAAADMLAQRNAVQDQVVSDKSRFFSWFWTPPVGTCVPSSGAVHGYAVSWDICSTVDNIRDLLGWLFGVLGLISVYNELFRKSEE